MKKIFAFLPYIAVPTGILLGAYYFYRVYFLFTPTVAASDQIMAFALLVGETYMIIHSVGFIIHIFRLRNNKRLHRFASLDGANLPSVAVVVAARHEPKDVLSKTLTTLNNLTYKNKKLYLLDGSTDPNFLEVDKMLCKQFGVHFFTPNEIHGTKAPI